MAGFLRLLLGMALLPACWGVSRAFFDAIIVAAGATGWMSAEALSLLGGILAFSLAWLALSHPVRLYVLGHELTHAMWGLLFGARPSDVRVSASGGSVRLSKSNLLITLAPYFFPFYTFIVIVVALITYAFFKPLPYLPLWLFLVNVGIVLVWLALMTPLTFADLGGLLAQRIISAYTGLFEFVVRSVVFLWSHLR